MKVGKTPYVRFDLNDYMVPHTHMRRTLSVRTDLEQVRVFDGGEMIASHRRSYARGAQIENPQHLKTLEQFKHHARQHRGVNSLTKAVPACLKLLDCAAERGANIGGLTTALLRLLGRYGAAELQLAVEEAPRKGSAHANTVRAALERPRSARGTPPPVAVNLPQHVRRQDTPVQPHKLDTYDQLTAGEQDDVQSEQQYLRVNGLLEHWSKVEGAEWVPPLLQWEEDERAHRSLQRRVTRSLAASRRSQTSSGLADATNVVFIGPNGVGKSTLARNLANQALIAGHSVLFRSANETLGELALDSDSALRRRLHHYAAPDILVIDEIGYLSYANRHADLLFELISRRYEARSTIVTTNKAFKDWSEVFPNAACVVSLIDRLVHRSEVISIEGKSYRLKEARERTEARARQRKTRTPATKKGLAS